MRASRARANDATVRDNKTGRNMPASRREFIKAIGASALAAVGGAPAFAQQPASTTGKRMTVIDCHGHYTTAPQALRTYRQRQIAGLKDPSQVPSRAVLSMSDDQLR